MAEKLPIILGTNNAFEEISSGDTLPASILPAMGGSQETLSGTIDGSNKVFTFTADPGTSFIAFRNGQALLEGASNDYTISGTTLTLTASAVAPSGTDVMWAIVFDGTGTAGGGGASLPAPSLRPGTVVSATIGETIPVVVRGSFFTSDMSVSISNAEISCTISEFRDSNEIVLDVTATGSAVVGTYNLVFDNGTESTFTGVVNCVTELVEKWIDLRTGGTTLTVGNDNTYDIEVNGTMAIVRDAEGAYFNNSFTWSSFARFHICSYDPAVTAYDIEFITKNVDATGDHMVSVIDADVALSGNTYFYPNTSVYIYNDLVYRLYGTNQTPPAGAGVTGTATSGWKIQYDSPVKLRIRNGGKGGVILLAYDQDDWDSAETWGFIHRLDDSATFSGTPLCPCIHPPNTDAAFRIIGIRLTNPRII